MKSLSQLKQGNKFTKLASIFHLPYKSSHFHLGIWPCRVTIPIAPLDLAVSGLDSLGGFDELFEIEIQIVAAVEVVEIGDAAEQFADDDMELRMCMKLVIEGDAGGSEEGDIFQLVVFLLLQPFFQKPPGDFPSAQSKGQGKR